MLTQDVSQELKEILEQLHQEGKEPSVALVKTRLSTPIPIPALVTTLKSWKNTKHIPKVEVATSKVNQQDRITYLEQQVSDLTKRLIALEAKLPKSG